MQVSADLNWHSARYWIGLLVDQTLLAVLEQAVLVQVYSALLMERVFCLFECQLV